MTPRKVPTYRLHKASGQAVVVLNGTSIYLGPFDSPESRARYDRVVARYLTDRAEPGHPAARGRPGAVPGELTVSEMVLRYWTFAKGYYVKNGKPSGEAAPMRQALRALRRHAGDAPAAEFGPLAMKALRDALLVQPITRRVKVTDPATGLVAFADKVVRVGLARRTANKQVGRVKRAFAWAFAEELVPARVHEALARVAGLRQARTAARRQRGRRHEALARVAGLRQGRSAARETPRVRPAPDADVDAVLPHVPPAVAAMVRVQRFAGCRPHEVVLMRGAEIDTSAAVWEYRPSSHKSEHLGGGGPADRERVIFLGPRAQAVLAPFIADARGGYLFSPRLAQRQRVRERGLSGPGSPRGEHYGVGGYRQEVLRGCDRAGVPRWVPLQLRHAAGTAIRKRFGLERAQAVLGHRELGVTQVYAEVDQDAARAVMAEVG